MTCIGLLVLVLVGVRRRMSAEIVQDPPPIEWAPVICPYPSLSRTLFTPFVHKKINETLFFFLVQGAAAVFCPCPFILCLSPRQPKVLTTVEHPCQSDPSEVRLKLRFADPSHYSRLRLPVNFLGVSTRCQSVRSQTGASAMLDPGLGEGDLELFPVSN